MVSVQDMKLLRTEGAKLSWRWFFLGVVITSLLFLFLVHNEKLYNNYHQSVQNRKDNGSWKNRLRCDTCSLVGTSGSLLSSGQGINIEVASCVFRLGFSPAKEMEADVGYRTTARIVDYYRFSPFLKKPEKVFGSRYASSTWFIFGGAKNEEQSFRDIIRKWGERPFWWLDKQQELAAMASLRKYVSQREFKLLFKYLTSLWVAVVLMEQAGCSQFTFFGIPDPRLCKRSPEQEVRSVFWNQRSDPLCQNGRDAGLYKPGSSVPLESPSLLERRALKTWAVGKKVRFLQPNWWNT